MVSTILPNVNGSMIFTRDDYWKEVKVIGVFKSSDRIGPNENKVG